MTEPAERRPMPIQPFQPIRIRIAPDGTDVAEVFIPAASHIAQGLATLGEQFARAAAPLRAAAAAFFGLGSGRPSRAEQRAARALTPAQRRARRAERRHQQRRLTAARRAHAAASHSRRRRARRRQRDLQLTRYRGHPARTSRLTP